MARPDRLNPWMALVPLALLILAIWVTLRPLTISTPQQPQMAHYLIHCGPAEAAALEALPIAGACRPVMPSWPVSRQATVSPTLSLNRFAG